MFILQYTRQLRSVLRGAVDHEYHGSGGGDGAKALRLSGSALLVGPSSADGERDALPVHKDPLPSPPPPSRVGVDS